MSKNQEGETTELANTKKSVRDSAYGQDSLRFSYEFDRLSTVSSADDKQINFQFEDYHEFESKANNEQKENSFNDPFSSGNPTRKIGIFNKYRQDQEPPQESQETDIGHSFDKIFNNSSDKEAITKKFLKKKAEEHYQHKNFGSQSYQAQMGQGLFSDRSSYSDKKQQETKDDIFDKIVNEQTLKQTTPKGQRSQILSPNHTTFDPFHQNFVTQNHQIKQVQKQFTKKPDNISPVTIKPTISNQVTNPAAQVKTAKVNIKWSYGGNSSEQEYNSDKSIPLGNVNEITNGKLLLDGNKSSDAYDAIHATNDWNNPNLKLNSNNSFHSIESNESSSSKKSDVSLDKSFEKLSLKDPQGKKSSLNMGLDSETLNRNELGMKKLSMPIFDEEQRATPFLKKIRRMNSIYPNFNHPNINIEMESRFCNSLAVLFEEALKVLEQVVFKVLQRARQGSFLPIEFTSIEFFTKSQWELEKQKEWNQINSTIKPKLNLGRSQINEAKIMKALSNYKEVIGYYKQKKVDLSTEEGIKGYFRAREKFWNLEKNMRSISEDVYQLYPATDYPQFYYDYLNVLKSPLASKNDTATIMYHKQVLDVLISNQQRGQQLSISAVGQAVRLKIERELKFLFPF